MTLVRPIKGLSKSARATAKNRIDRKHVDFVICDQKTLQVVGVIELDDSSHRRNLRDGDEVKDKALAAAGIPIVRIQAQRGYNPAEIREKISGMLNWDALNS